MLRKLTLALPAAILAAGLYYADTIVFAAPIVAVSLWLGSWTAFVVFVPIYFLFDYALGRLALALITGKLRPDDFRRYGWPGRAPARAAAWIQAWFWSLHESPLGAQIRNRLSSSRGGRSVRYAGFVVASYFGTAFLTIPGVYLLGQRRHLRLLTAFSAVVYALTFVGQYAGATFITVKVVEVAYGLLF